VMITFVPSFLSETVRVHNSLRDAEEARLTSLNGGQPEGVKSGLEAWDAAHPAPRASIKDIADHIEHAIQIAGEDHVGIGGDLDGIESTPIDMTSVADYPKLFAELIRRGHSDEQLKKIAGLNVLRVMRQAETIAAKLQKDRLPAEAQIEELDKK